MVIYQSRRKHAQAVEELLGVSPRAGSDNRSGNEVVTFNVPMADKKAITEYFRDRSDLPGIVGRLSREAADAMYQAMMSAEGSTSPIGQEHFAQAAHNGYVRDAFQILAQLTGRWANISGQGCYVGKESSFKPFRTTGGRVHYTGAIWCPTTPSGCWVMRHNGKVCITGNSFTRRNLPPVLSDLADKPAKLAGTMRILTGGRTRGEFTPDYIAEGAALPLEGAPAGQQRYLASFGLPVEDEGVKTLGSLLQGDFGRGCRIASGHGHALSQGTARIHVRSAVAQWPRPRRPAAE